LFSFTRLQSESTDSNSTGAAIAVVGHLPRKSEFAQAPKSWRVREDGLHQTTEDPSRFLELLAAGHAVDAKSYFTDVVGSTQPDHLKVFSHTIIPEAALISPGARGVYHDMAVR
jgi:hypothetical protein